MPSREQRQRLQAFVRALLEEHDTCDTCKQAIPSAALDFVVTPSVTEMIQLGYGAKRLGKALQGCPIICANCKAKKPVGYAS